jgi:DNA-binding CsgD family transcriptional regulator
MPSSGHPKPFTPYGLQQQAASAPHGAVGSEQDVRSILRTLFPVEQIFSVPAAAPLSDPGAVTGEVSVSAPVRSGQTIARIDVPAESDFTAIVQHCADEKGELHTLMIAFCRAGQIFRIIGMTRGRPWDSLESHRLVLVAPALALLVAAGELSRTNAPSNGQLSRPPALWAAYVSEESSSSKPGHLSAMHEATGSNEPARPPPAPDRNPDSNLQRLSKREYEVARLLAEGYSSVNVAAVLGVSEYTVRTYTRRVYQKLKISNRADLVRKIVGL